MTGHQDTSPVGTGYVCFKILHSLLLGFVGVYLVLNFCKGQGICLLIIHYLIVPECNLGYFPGIFPDFVSVFFLHGGHLLHTGGHAGNYLVVVVVVTLQDGNARMRLLVMVLYPFAKTGQRGGEGGNPEGQGLQGSVTPRLVIGREKGQVHAAEEGVIRQVEDAVVPIEVGRDKIHLHLVSYGIGESQLTQAAGYGVILRIHQVMGGLAAVLRIAVSAQLGLQFLVRSVMA